MKRFGAWYFFWKFMALGTVGVAIYAVSNAGGIAAIAYVAGLGFAAFDHLGELCTA